MSEITQPQPIIEQKPKIEQDSIAVAEIKKESLMLACRRALALLMGFDHPNYSGTVKLQPEITQTLLNDLT